MRHFLLFISLVPALALANLKFDKLPALVGEKLVQPMQEALNRVTPSSAPYDPAVFANLSKWYDTFSKNLIPSSDSIELWKKIQTEENRLRREHAILFETPLSFSAIKIIANLDLSPDQTGLTDTQIEEVIPGVVPGGDDTFGGVSRFVHQNNAAFLAYARLLKSKKEWAEHYDVDFWNVDRIAAEWLEYSPRYFSFLEKNRLDHFGQAIDEMNRWEKQKKTLEDKSKWMSTFEFTLLAHLNDSTPWRTWKEEKKYLTELFSELNIVILAIGAGNPLPKKEHIQQLGNIYERIILSLVKTYGMKEAFANRVIERVQNFAIAVGVVSAWFALKYAFYSNSIVEATLESSALEKVGVGVAGLLGLFCGTSSERATRFNNRRIDRSPPAIGWGMSHFESKLLKRLELSDTSDLGRQTKLGFFRMLETNLWDNSSEMNPGGDELFTVLPIGYAKSCALAVLEI